MKRLLLLGGLMAANSLYGAVQVTYERQALNVLGVSRGGNVAVFGVNLGASEGYGLVHKEARLVTDEANTGSIRVSLDYSIAFRSLWVVCDLETGTYTVSTPPGFRPRIMAAPLISVADSSLHIQKPSVEVFVIRPKLGAWELSVADGRDGDDDGPMNGGITIASEHLRGVGSTPPGPKRFVPGDIVVFCNTDWMEYAVVQVPPPGAHNAN